MLAFKTKCGAGNPETSIEPALLALYATFFTWPHFVGGLFLETPPQLGGSVLPNMPYSVHMDQLAKLGKWLPAVWLGLATLILVLDYLAGPFISLAILFVIPVALASRFSGSRWGITLGVMMPMSHMCFAFLEDAPGTLADSLINVGIRTVALVAFAILIDRVTRQAREIRVLQGLLPVCGFCKKIRKEDQNWQSIESFISERSEASFTHTVCPECAKQHYGEYYDKIKARLDDAPQRAPR